MALYSESIENDREIVTERALITEDVEREKRVDVVLKKPRFTLIKKIKTWFNNNLLLSLTLIGIIIGFVIGLTVRPVSPSKTALMWIGFPGELFMRLLRLLILPLLVSSIISGMATLDPRSNGKISLVALVWIVLTNTMGAIFGIIFSLIISAEETTKTDANFLASDLQTEDIFADLFRNIFPDNMIEVAFRQAQTKYYRERSNGTNGTETVVLIKTVGFVRSSNLLGLVICCILIAIAANKCGERTQVFVKFFDSATDIFLTILRWALWSTPLGVCSLIAGSIAAIEDIEGTFQKVALFVVAVTVGMAVHQLIALPAILASIMRTNPFVILATTARVWIVAFATTSTAVAIPEMLESAENMNGVDKRVSRFTVPFSVTLGACGSAIFIATGAVFMALITETPLSPGGYITILVLASISAMSIPSIPSAGIVTLNIILTSVQIPDHHMGLLFAVEWFLDRIRTTSNALSHVACAIITNRICRNDL